MMYTFHNGNLIECQPIITVVTNEDNNYVIDKVEVKHNGETFSVRKEQPFYKTENDYKQGTELHMSEINYNYFLREDCWSIEVNSSCYHYNNDNMEVKKYIPKNNIKSFKFEYKSFNKIYIERSDIIDGFIPDELFLCREEAFAYNDYKVVKDDGTEEVKKGYLHKLLLNEKQQEIIDRLRAVMKEIDENNMIVFISNEDEWIRIVNDPNMRTSEWYDCGCEGFDTELFIPNKQEIVLKSIFVHTPSDWGVNIKNLNKEDNE